MKRSMKSTLRRMLFNRDLLVVYLALGAVAGVFCWFTIGMCGAALAPDAVGGWRSAMPYFLIGGLAFGFYNFIHDAWHGILGEGDER